MAKAKKSKVSRVAEKVETVKKKSPPKPKKPILESILESLDDDQKQALSIALKRAKERKRLEFQRG